MSRPLSRSVLQQLTPALGSLASVASEGGYLNRGQLESLLVGTGLESDTASLEELELWAELLWNLRQDTRNERHRVVSRALRLRGLRICLLGPRLLSILPHNSTSEAAIAETVLTPRLCSDSLSCR